MCERAAERSEYVLKYVPDPYKTKEMRERFIER